MKRREFLNKAAVTSAGVAVAASTLAAPAVAQERIEMVIVATWPRDFPGLGTGAQRMAQRISDMTDGRIQVSYFAAKERVGSQFLIYSVCTPMTICFSLSWPACRLAA